jgi:hypothetical protein
MDRLRLRDVPQAAEANHIAVRSVEPASNLRPNLVIKYPFFILLSWATASVAQDLPRWFDPLSQVRSYLELTESQYNAILANNDGTAVCAEK